VFFLTSTANRVEFASMGQPKGLVSENAYTILNEVEEKRASLIAALQELQVRYRYLPETAMRQVAARMGVSVGQVYHIATFYTCFRLEPMGRHHVRVCHGTACHVRGSMGIQNEIERQLGVKKGETTSDNRFTLDAVNCLGCCALAPVMVVNEDYYHMSKSKIEKTIKKYE